MSDLRALSDQLASFAGTMSPYIVQKAFADMNIAGENIPPTMRRKVVDMILNRIIFDREKHHALRRELLNTLTARHLQTEKYISD